MIPSSLETCPALQSYQRKELIATITWFLFWFDPEENADPMAFCSHFRDDAMSVCTKHQSPCFQGCRPCELRLRAPPPDPLMVTHTTALPGSPRSAVSDDFHGVSLRFCPRRSSCWRLCSPAVAAGSSCCQNPGLGEKLEQFYHHVSFTTTTTTTTTFSRLFPPGLLGTGCQKSFQPTAD